MSRWGRPNADVAARVAGMGRSSLNLGMHKIGEVRGTCKPGLGIVSSGWFGVTLGRCAMSGHYLCTVTSWADAPYYITTCALSSPLVCEHSSARGTLPRGTEAGMLAISEPLHIRIVFYSTQICVEADNDRMGRQVGQQKREQRYGQRESGSERSAAAMTDIN